MNSLNIIGCGKVGKTLGRLFHLSGVFQIGDLLNRSEQSSAAAAAFIGAGQPVSALHDMRPADLYLIAASDDEIGSCAERLAASGVIRRGDVAWHVSGALPSAVLDPLREQGCAVASLHPVRSFADPAVSVAEFPGTWCAIEGDQEAVSLLSHAVKAVGGNLFPIDADQKTVYHAGSVMVCNYLTSLMEVGLRCYEKAGLPRETALHVMEPLVRGTVENLFREGTERALTGPIARGDVAVVSRQLDALAGWDPEVALLYRSLGRVALEISSRIRAGASPQLEELLA